MGEAQHGGHAGGLDRLQHGGDGRVHVGGRAAGLVQEGSEGEIKAGVGVAEAAHGALSSGKKASGERLGRHVDDQTIISEEDYAQALAALERLWGAPPGTPQGDELEAMTAIVNAYEDEHAAFD